MAVVVPSFRQLLAGPNAWFWQRATEQPNGCWTVTRRKQGYGAVMYEGKRRRASRVAYLLVYGVWPLNACHHCDNPPCIRPDHLFSGSLDDNMQDMVRKGRHGSQVHPECHQRGELNSINSNRRKHTEQQIRRMRRAFQKGVPVAALAVQYKTPVRHVRKIVKHESWSWLM